MIPDKYLKFIAGESDRTKKDLAGSRPDEVLMKFYARHDQVVAAVLANSDEKIACRAGCWYCCYFKVEAKAVEVIKIVEYVKKTFPAEQLEVVTEKAKENIEEFSRLDHSQQVSTNQACPFLLEEKCSIYEVRPSKCRNAHATDVSLCQACYENPADTSIPSSYHQPLHLAVNGLTHGFESALQEKGYDIRAYDISEAFVAALQNPKFSKRYFKGKKALSK